MLAITSAMRRVAHAWRCRQQRQAWNALGADQQELRLRDLGLARLDESLFWSGERSPLEQLPRMMDVYGVEHADTILAGPGVRRDLERVCSRCPEKARCKRVLASEPAAEACGFCPNAATLEALRRH
ncbi:DUF6455 family protein [Halomonas mongoliensis]|uniref:DUF6455 family protein n=1 Tax=Halomonas mongoliensis TaxID=321265 RepID=A0ABU1GN84_9GAMM|nr:DUF6455 family protein [Halomonas mongoliensis]MDR5893439.1 DUF6455 family protein [Halomonas mongoliensis]